MKVSLNIVKQLTTVDLPVSKVVAKINEQLGQVEETIDLSVRYNDAIIVKIMQCEKHTDADKLSVCKIDDGGAVADVERDEGGYVQVVCGAPNAREGIYVVWLPPQSTVPSSYDSKEGIFTLEARKIRGVMSYGMLSGADELGLSDKHETILEIDPTEWKPSDVEIKPGARFAAAYGLDDVIIDMENKMFTHRPDCFGQIGVAREIAGIQGIQFRSPEWYGGDTSEVKSVASGEQLPLTVRNDAPTNVPRFMAVAIRDVTIKPSPLWLQCELVRLGGKPINNIVDVTNYIMLMTAQPLHAYDYDKLRGATLGAQQATQDEKLPLLNGKTYELTPDDTVIVDGEGPVGLGGVMGGGNSEVSDTTKNIVLECATFDMYAIRKTSMRHGLFTDAVTRYNKGQSPLQNPYVIAQALTMMMELSGGQQASEVFDAGHMEDDTWNMAVETSPEFINDRLGLRLSFDEIHTLLENVEFVISPRSNSHMLIVQPPFWRTDIQLPEDIVEEVGRLYGFDKLPRELPQRSMKPAAKNALRETQRYIRESLSRSGANEVLTYSFVHEKTMRRAEQDPAQAFRLGNALSPELQYYRLSVLPSLLEKVHGNIKAGHDEFVLFEIGKGHNKQYIHDDDGLPREDQYVDAIYTSKKQQDGAAFYHIKELVAQLMSDLGIALHISPIVDDMPYAVTAPFELSRSALLETIDGDFIGIVGELKSSVVKNFKLPVYSAAMTLDLANVHAARVSAVSQYQPLSRYPSVSQDISLKVGAETKYYDVFGAARQAVDDQIDRHTVYDLQPISIFSAPDDAAHKTITLRLKVSNYEHTLTDKDVTVYIDAIAALAHEKLNATQA